MDLNKERIEVESLEETKFVLSEVCQVREEEFGLLFYSMYGPRLYFLNCGQRLSPEFFQGRLTLGDWLEERGQGSGDTGRTLATCLRQLMEKGVIRGV
ncbi:MAG: mycofactocin biosynthesis chaperone MftB [Deltaproteobacteria bacterium]|nr:mycofactocin biosynthesis chaperone MftB [Deltaproteobacteria bacterium]